MKRIVEIVVAIMAMGAITFVVLKYAKPHPVISNEIEILKDSIAKEKLKADSLQNEIDTYDQYVKGMEAAAKIKHSNNQIVINTKYEKISDSVRVLNIDGDINFFTKYLTKNDSIK